jgi:hypothetical protein
MTTKIVITLIIIGLICLGIIGYLIWGPVDKKPNLPNPLAEITESKKTTPSTTLIDYTDPAGFSFSYPDNISLSKNESEDLYADLELYSKEVNGSLMLKIVDSKYKTIDEWVKSTSKDGAKDVILGTLKAKEIKTSDRLYLGSVDQGIFFSIELPRINDEFWMPVYQKLLANFSFTAPEVATSVNAGSAEGVVFESEEVVE